MQDDWWIWVLIMILPLATGVTYRPPGRRKSDKSSDQDA